MRGSHEGSYEVAHALAWRGERPAHYRALDEHYELVVVGAGMSGLAAAWFYRKKMGPEARILVLDNHDDFGGHAKRNEFHHRGKMLLSFAGAQNLENPDSYSEASSGLLADLGIDIDAMAANMTEPYTLAADFNADHAMSLPAPDGHVTVGGNWWQFMHGKGDYTAAVRALPIPAVEQNKLIAFFGGDEDYLDGLSLREKYSYIETTSYNQFLVERVGLQEDTLAILNGILRFYSGVTGWNLSVLEAIASTAPGLQGMGWLGALVDSLAINFADQLVQVRIFPDGNASVARLLVHKLIPDVAPTMSGFEDVATSRFDYAALDRHDQGTRIRLNSTVVGARQSGDRVEVDYVQKGEALRVTADHCVLACYNGLIPHLCPEMPDNQKEALRYGVKIPFVYANVLLDNGHAFSKVGASFVSCPSDSFLVIAAAPPTTSGGYQPPSGPDDPMVVLMMASPTPAPQGNESVRDLLRLGRHKIYATSFATYEQEIRDQLQSLLGVHGFDHEKDIRAITVNRIPHGYAYGYMALEDPEWAEGQAPHEIGRAQFGRISIANSDSEARAYMDAAFDAAWRAVEEQTS
jgi:spermidine dehydrogenase